MTLAKAVLQLQRWTHAQYVNRHTSVTPLKRLNIHVTRAVKRPGIRGSAQHAEPLWAKHNCVLRNSTTASSTVSPTLTHTRNSFVVTTKDEDTIAAVVTGALSQASVAIIRISGSDALEVASRVFCPGGQRKLGWQPQSHKVYYGTVMDGDGDLLDEVLLLCMHSPRSYTCEDVVEIHTHGGPVCVARVMQAVIEAGARRARPGEFTLRAFLNGRLDLSQAEAVSELLQARTPRAADAALAGLRGGVGAAVATMRQDCLALLAELEARLDFDEDLPAMDSERIAKQVELLAAGIEDALRTAHTGTLLRQGLQAAIVGRPNVGKSSLLNAWTRSDRSIVTEVAGTTRDVVEAGLVVGGVPLTLLDTAGIRDSMDAVEKIGVERSRRAAVATDVVIMVVDAQAGWTAADGEIFKGLWGDGPGSRTCAVRGMAILVVNKSDLVLQGDGPSWLPTPIQLPVVAREVFSQIVYTSAKDGKGLKDLDKALLDLAGVPELAGGGMSWAVNERQAEALVRAHEAVMRVAESIQSNLPMDFWTIDLRSVLIALGEVSGDEVTEEILDSVFSRFCIGK